MRAARPPALPLRIAGTAEVLPGEPVPTEQVALEVGLDPAVLRGKTGIHHRWRAAPDETFVALAARAVAAALRDADVAPAQVGRLLFTSSLGGDTLTPANATAVGAAVGATSAACFDVGSGCMGFLTALDVGARFVATAGEVVVVVASELGTRFVRSDDPRPYAVFGDAAGAAVLVPAAGGGLLASWLQSDGRSAGQVELRNGAALPERVTLAFGASHRQMGAAALALFRRGVREALRRADLALDEVEWVLPHQPNGPMLARVLDALGVGEERVVPVVHEVGSVGAASVPLALHRLRASGRLRPGQHVLLAGVGAGVSYGAAIYREPTAGAA